MATDRRTTIDPFEPAPPPASDTRPRLNVVSGSFALVQPDMPPPEDWQAALSDLFDWLGMTVEVVSESALRSVGRLPRWGTKAQASPVFAPWIVWSSSAFQQGGCAGLPRADWAESYLVDPGAGLRGAAARGIDLALISPLPSACFAENVGDAPVPRAEVLRAMIQSARSQGRGRIAIICQAGQRNAIARQLLAADRALTREGLSLDILTIEDALRTLIDGAAPWDAVIAMPEVRSIVFTMLVETTGVTGPWPMLWRRLGTAQSLLLVTSETSGEGQRIAALDAPALIQGLALYCRNARIEHAARRLYQGWARLRDGGVTTVGRSSSAPYAKQVSDSDFIAMLTRGLAAGRRDVPNWSALGDAASVSASPSPRALRIVADNSSTLSY